MSKLFIFLLPISLLPSTPVIGTIICESSIILFTFLTLPYLNDFFVQLSKYQSVTLVTSRVRLFATPWTAAHQASLSFTNSQTLLKLMSIELVMPSNHLILCHSLFLLSLIFPRIRVFFTETVLHIRWPKYWSFSFSISPSNEYEGLVSFRVD